MRLLAIFWSGIFAGHCREALYANGRDSFTITISQGQPQNRVRALIRPILSWAVGLIRLGWL